MYEPTDVVRTEDQIRQIVPQVWRTQTAKILDHVDDLCAAWIRHSPFLTMATVSADGRVDVAPRGDPPGFVRVLDPHSLAVPDRPGNHRYDSFLNILQTGRIGLCFFVPNRNEVVRVNGSARIVRDTALRESMAVNGRIPDFAVLVRVEEAFYHCGKAIIRAGLWAPEKAMSVESLPTYGAAIKAHARDERSLAEMDRVMRHNEEHRLYDE